MVGGGLDTRVGRRPCVYSVYCCKKEALSSERVEKSSGGVDSLVKIKKKKFYPK